jgi:hypothetical protein
MTAGIQGSQNHATAEVAGPPTLKRDWRFYSGVTAMVLAVVMPLCALLVPVLGLPTAQSAVLVGVLVAGGPEVLCILAVALLGKDTFQYFTHQAKSAFRRALIDRPASKTRYYLGLTIMLVSWLPAYLYAYFPASLPGGDTRIYILAGMAWLSSRASFSWAESSGKKCDGYSFTKARFETETAPRRSVTTRSKSGRRPGMIDGSKSIPPAKPIGDALTTLGNARAHVVKSPAPSVLSHCPGQAGRDSEKPCRCHDAADYRRCFPQFIAW